MTRALACFVVLFALAAAAPAAAELSAAAIARALQHGGYVIVMRHASSPMTPPDAADADAGNTGRERQLDAAGKASATAMGAAIRRLHLKIGRVWSSPTYRALETARLAGLPTPTAAPELGDRGRSMSAASDDQSTWLRAKAGERPAWGADDVLITHMPNIVAAFGDAAKGISDGEALIFQPGRKGQAELVARVPMSEWPELAGR